MISGTSWTTRAKVSAAIMGMIVVATASGLFGASLAPALTGAEHDGTIHGCVNRYTGALRITPADGQCSPSERPLSWSEQLAGGIVDIQTVTASTAIDDNAPDNSVSVSVECPAGYQVIGGGAGLSFALGNNIETWAMSYSSPVEAGSGVFVNDGWLAIFQTVDGQNSDGSFSFFADAVCLLTS
jgi:hypothetical protein